MSTSISKETKLIALVVADQNTDPRFCALDRVVHQLGVGPVSGSDYWEGRAQAWFRVGFDLGFNHSEINGIMHGWDYASGLTYGYNNISWVEENRGIGPYGAGIELGIKCWELANK